LIQTTLKGGKHYAFMHAGDVLMQGTDLFKLKGFDVRRPGAGFIATGEGYTAHGFGVLRMVHPGSLPQLPPAAALKLRKPDRQAEKPTKPLSPQEVENAKAALAAIDPDEGRDDWIRVLMAMRHLFADDPEAGLEIFHEWSAGEYTEDQEPPAKYVDYDAVVRDWDSVKPGGGVSGGTLFHKAMENGWRPSSGFDTSAVFGQGAASADLYADMIDDINANALNPKEQPRIIDAVKAFRGSSSQVATLRAQMVKLLKDDGQLTQQLKGMLDEAAPRVNGVPGAYSKSDAHNCSVFLSRRFPDDNITMHGDEVYVYQAGHWSSPASPKWLQSAVFSDMVSAIGGEAMVKTANSCAEGVKSLLTANGVELDNVDPDCVFFSDAMLNTRTGQITPSSKEHGNTTALPYNYDAHANCHEWLEFLNSTLEGDQERIALLQEWMGYNLVRRYDHQKIMMLIGKSRAGKGLVGKVMEALCGTPAFTGGSLSALTRDPTLAACASRLVYFVGDCEKSVPHSIRSAVSEKLKTISGNDAVTFERKFLPSITARLPVRITVSTNHIPAIFDDSGALANRLLILPFDVSFAGREDITLEDRIIKEVPGIALWAVEGLRRLDANKRFTEPEASKLEREEINSMFSPMRDFVSACLEPCDDATLSSSDMFDAYAKWCLSNRETPMQSAKGFTEAIRRSLDYGRYGRPVVDGRQVRGFWGVKLTDRTALATNVVAGEFGSK
jgi:P4 family phage/plasmid primase-like protien